MERRDRLKFVSVAAEPAVDCNLGHARAGGRSPHDLPRPGAWCRPGKPPPSGGPRLSPMQIYRQNSPADSSKNVRHLAPGTTPDRKRFLWQ